MDNESNCEETAEILPFFPRYDSEPICQDKLRVTWFEVDFSQSRYNFEKKISGSNACTIIALLVAAFCHKESIKCYGPHRRTSYSMIRSLGKAIIDGNDIHSSLKETGTLSNINLTVPEAIKYSGKRVSGIKEWKSVLYMQLLNTSLYTNLNNHWIEWKKSVHSKKHSDLYIILIADSRSVLFIMDDIQKTVTLVDSHQHTTTKGALIAVVKNENLRCLCAWLAHVILKYYHVMPKLYELSFLYFRKRKK